jgi:hypothetical protein
VRLHLPRPARARQRAAPAPPAARAARSGPAVRRWPVREEAPGRHRLEPMPAEEGKQGERKEKKELD